MYTVGLNWYEMEMNRTLYRKHFHKGLNKADFYQKTQ